MKTRIAATLVMAALIVPITGYAADMKSITESVKENVGDAVITAKIKAEYAKDKEVSALKVKVDTDNKGVVTLSGSAGSRAEADKAVKIARGTKGVSLVKDEITLLPK